MFKFAWPYAFLLLPFFWIITNYLPKNKKPNEAMLRIPFLFRIKAINQEITPAFSIPKRLTQVTAFFIWLLLIIACANPEWLGKPILVAQTGRNIMLAIDLSQSMGIPDLKRNNQMQNRLQTVKEVAANFIEKRHGDKLGLILFGSKAYLQTSLTHDRKTVRNMLEDATLGLAGERTAIGDAIGLAVKKFDSENIKSRILILFTDGANNAGSIDPIKAAELAKENKIKIYTVGIGASEMEMPSIFGTQLVNPSADLDESTLKKIAELTDGQYFRAQDEKTLVNILEAINQLEPVTNAGNTFNPVTPLFYWPLTMALLLLACLFYPTFDLKPRL